MCFCSTDQPLWGEDSATSGPKAKSVTHNRLRDLQMLIINELLLKLVEASVTKLDADRMIGIFNILNSIYQTGHAANF